MGAGFAEQQVEADPAGHATVQRPDELAGDQRQDRVGDLGRTPGYEDLDKTGQQHDAGDGQGREARSEPGLGQQPDQPAIEEELLEEGLHVDVDRALHEAEERHPAIVAGRGREDERFQPEHDDIGPQQGRGRQHPRREGRQQAPEGEGDGDAGDLRQAHMGRDDQDAGEDQEGAEPGDQRAGTLPAGNLLDHDADREPDGHIAEEGDRRQVRIEEDGLQRGPVFVQVDGRHIGVEPVTEPCGQQQRRHPVGRNLAQQRQAEILPEEPADRRADRRAQRIGIKIGGLAVAPGIVILQHLDHEAETHADQHRHAELGQPDAPADGDRTDEAKRHVEQDVGDEIAPPRRLVPALY